MRFVFDTNALISSTLWGGSVSQKLLHKLILSGNQIFSSTEIILEYQKILRREFDYSDVKLNSIKHVVFSFLEIVEANKKLDVVKDDPDDNKIIECAVASSSDYIITYDKHLLKLKKFGTTKIITPEEALKLI